jgi:ABC-2 type transport system permease protein
VRPHANPGSPGGRHRMPGAQPPAGHAVRHLRTEGPAVTRQNAPGTRHTPGQRPAGFGGALRSELTKIRTVRSTYWTLVAMIAVTVFTGVVTCVFTGPGAAGPGYDPTYLSLQGCIFGQLIIAVLGAVAITSEYSTGMIRASLTVQPRRGTVYAAKAAAVALVAMAAGLAASFTSFLLGQAILDRRDLGTSLGQPHVLRAVIGAGLFLAVSGLLALGLGAIFRSAAGAIAAASAVLFMTIPVEAFLPAAMQTAVDRWIPFNAGSQVFSTVADPSAHQFSPWAGFTVFTAYSAAALAAGLLLFRRRDA